MPSRRLQTGLRQTPQLVIADDRRLSRAQACGSMPPILGGQDDENKSGCSIVPRRASLPVSCSIACCNRRLHRHS